MPENDKTIFISYSWKEFEAANTIDRAFQNVGITIQRDIRGVDYMGSLKEFMKGIRKTDYVIILISDSFLKSSNCMFEILSLIKDENYTEKILPILIDDTNIYTPSNKIGYVKFWNDKWHEISNEIAGLNPTDVLNRLGELKHFENIRGTMDEFLTIICDRKIKTFSELEKENFQTLFNHLSLDEPEQKIVNLILLLKNLSSDEREIKFDELSNQFPNNSKIYFTRGAYSYEEGKIKQSTYYYRRAIALDDTFSPSYYNLGYNLEVFEKDFEGARDMYLKAILYDPKNHKAFSNLGGLYMNELDDKDKAHEYLKNALELDYSDAINHFNYGILMKGKFSDYSKAKKHFELSLKYNPSLVEAKFEYGLLLYDNYHLVAEAEEQLNGVLEIDASFKPALNVLGQINEYYYSNFEGAKNFYEKELNLNVDSAIKHYQYCAFLITRLLSKYKSEAIEHYKIAKDLDPNYQNENFDTVLFS